MKSVAVLAAALGLLFGCSTVSSIGQSDTGARVVVEIATLATIEQSNDRAVTAQRIIQAATDLQSWFDADGVTVEDLATEARVRIVASDLELSQKAALDALVTILAAEISARVSAGVLDPATRLTVNTMLGWVATAARAYAG